MPTSLSPLRRQGKRRAFDASQRFITRWGLQLPSSLRADCVGIIYRLGFVASLSVSQNQKRFLHYAFAPQIKTFTQAYARHQLRLTASSFTTH